MYALNLIDAPTDRSGYLIGTRGNRSTFRPRHVKDGLGDQGQVIVLDRFRPGRASPLDTPINVKQETHKSAEVDRARAQTARLTARLRMLKRLPYNHDGEGAAAPIPRSVDAALAFLPNIKTAMAYGVTLDDDGNAVVEFEDRATGSFADITFCADAHSVECYRRSVGRPSTAMCGVINSKEVLDFLREAGIIA